MNWLLKSPQRGEEAAVAFWGVSGGNTTHRFSTLRIVKLTVTTLADYLSGRRKIAVTG